MHDMDTTYHGGANTYEFKEGKQTITMLSKNSRSNNQAKKGEKIFLIKGEKKFSKHVEEAIGAQTIIHKSELVTPTDIPEVQQDER